MKRKPTPHHHQAQEQSTLATPLSGPRTWVLKGGGSKTTVEAKTWFEARTLGALKLGCPEDDVEAVVNPVFQDDL